MPLAAHEHAPPGARLWYQEYGIGLRRAQSPPSFLVAARWFSWRLALSLTFVCAAAQPLRAQAAAQTTAGSVEVVVVGTPDRLEQARRSIGAEAVAPSGLRFSQKAGLMASELIQAEPPGSDLRVRCWMDLRDPLHAKLYFVDRAAERFLFRELTLSGRNTELDREALSQMLELSIRALLEDDHAGMNRAQAQSILKTELDPTTAAAPEKDTEPLATPEEGNTATANARAGLAASLFWSAQLFSKQIPLFHGPGLALGYSMETAASRSSAWLSGQYQLPGSEITKFAGVTLQSSVLRGYGEWLSLPGSGAFFGGRLGVAFELTRITPKVGTQAVDLALTPARTRLAWSLSPALVAGGDLSVNFRLSFAAGVDLALKRVHYDLRLNDVLEPIVETYRVRPNLTLALSWR